RAKDSSRRWPRKYASRTAWSDRGVSKAKAGGQTRRAARRQAIEPSWERDMVALHVLRCAGLGTRFHMRRVMLGKSSQTLMPQKWEPSVQMGVVMSARMWHGGPM